MRNFFIALTMACTPISLLAQVVSKGIEWSLATERSSKIQHLAYEISLIIPSEKKSPIKATEMITFNTTGFNQPLQIDFKEDSSHLQSMRVNGHSTSIKLINEHIVIDQHLFHTGTNSITIDFIAGDGALNRNNDYLYALFVPERARTVFPCFDQPDLKATFTLSVLAPAGWKVLTNGSLKDSSTIGTQTNWHFSKSDKIPTYLFSFTAGNYNSVTKSGMELFYRETDTAKVRLSIDSIFQKHSEAIQFLEGWTEIKFPFQKIGFVAIPSFQFGGMEHPGEVQYNASSLFLDEGATREQQIGRAALISHETAHMWFGDLVTMKWFNDVWMKEVFANFMADKVTQKLLGDDMYNLKFLIDHYPAAYGVDRTPGANPIRQQLNNMQDAGSLYGNIIYHKAPIMMRQLELHMGIQNFQKGIQEYLRKYRYQNASWNDLMHILGKYTEKDLPSWNKVWVNQPGRPIFSYSLHAGELTIRQSAENGGSGIWPQKFSIMLFYPGAVETIPVMMNKATFTIPITKNPSYILFNSDGMGYGLFPANISDKPYLLKSPLQRATAYINAYENMLAGKVKPIALLMSLLEAIPKESNELTLQLITGHLSSIYWQFMSSLERKNIHVLVEETLWSSMVATNESNNKKVLFKTFQDIYLSEEASKRMYAFWQQQNAPEGIKLTEDDYTSLALTIALKNDTANSVLQKQLARITNEDRRSRLQFLIPAVSPDTVTRARFFMRLDTLANRRKEAWVITALSYLNHPLRQNSFVKYLPKALDMLETIQQTGDIFFPQRWLATIFGHYQSKEVWNIVEHFMYTHPHYNPKLKAKLLQTTDNLHRASRLSMSH